MQEDKKRQGPKPERRNSSKRSRNGSNIANKPASFFSESFRSLLKEIAEQGYQLRASWEEVGISELVEDGHSVAAFIKQRFADFVVNEIDQDGNVVRLVSCASPNPTEADEVRLSDEEILSQLKHTLDDFDEFLLFLRSDQQELALQHYSDKTKRSLVHSLLKQLQECDLYSTTQCDGDTKTIRISKGRPPAGVKSFSRVFPGRDCHYLQMALHKENVETMKAINALAHIAHVPIGRFSYAGNKDRRGITTQLVTAFKLDAQQLLEALPRLRSDVRIGNLRYVQDALQLGSLSGNRFGVVLRDLRLPETLSEIDLSRSLTSLSNRGFVNYFGLQRFGTGAVSTHLIGRAIMQSRFDLAVALILIPQQTQSIELRAALQYLCESGDINGTLNRLGKRDFIERTVLQYLNRFPTNYANALDCLPRNMKILYVHAYQSWIWNLMTSHRLKHFEREKPVLGDLVLDPSNPKDKQVIIIDKSNILKYSIFDVVLPLPGYSIALPDHGVGDYCRELLASHQITLESLNHRVRDYKLAGAYRPVIVKPVELQWNFFRYNDVTIPLIRSDTDLMSGLGEPQSVPDGDKLALCLQFSLPASAYATMLIREVLKREPMDWFVENQSCLHQDDSGDEIKVTAAER